MRLVFTRSVQYPVKRAVALPLNPAAQLCFRKLSKASVVALSLEQFQLIEFHQPFASFAPT